MNYKTFNELKHGDFVFYIEMIESAHSEFRTEMPYARRELFFYEKQENTVGITLRMNQSIDALKTIHSDFVITHVQPNATSHEIDKFVFCTTKEEADNILKELVLARLFYFDEIQKKTRKAYFELLNR